MEENIMEQKLVRVPFDIEMAKQITNGKLEGRIVRNDGSNVRIVCWNYKSLSGKYPLIALVENGIFEISELYTSEGKYKSWKNGSTEDKYDLSIELNKKEKYPFKPFDKVLVRDYTGTYWIANIFSNQYDIEGEIRYSCCGHAYKYCIPYNEQTAHLLGTTDNWEEKE